MKLLYIALSAALLLASCGDPEEEGRKEGQSLLAEKYLEKHSARMEAMTALIDVQGLLRNEMQVQEMERALAVEITAGGAELAGIKLVEAIEDVKSSASQAAASLAVLRGSGKEGEKNAIRIIEFDRQVRALIPQVVHRHNRDDGLDWHGLWLELTISTKVDDVLKGSYPVLPSEKEDAY